MNLLSMVVIGLFVFFVLFILYITSDAFLTEYKVEKDIYLQKNKGGLRK